MAKPLVSWKSHCWMPGPWKKFLPALPPVSGLNGVPPPSPGGTASENAEVLNQRFPEARGFCWITGPVTFTVSQQDTNTVSIGVPGHVPEDVPSIPETLSKMVTGNPFWNVVIPE